MRSFESGSIIHKHGVAAMKDIYKIKPNVFLMIDRRLNGNLVVYEAVVAQGAMEKIDVYWLDLDPKYKARARKRGRMHDRDEFCKMDHYAYGITVTHQAKTMWEFHFKRFPSQKFSVRLEQDGNTRCYTQIDDVEHKVHHVHIEDKPALGFLWPTVAYVEMVTYSLTTRALTTTRIKN